MNCDMNWVPLSEMICLGVPWCFHTLSTNNCAIPSEVTSLVVGMTWVCFVYRSTTTKMLSNPSLFGKSTMRLHVICCHGASGISLGLSGPCGLVGSTLVCLQRSHPSTVIHPFSHLWPPIVSGY